MLALLFVLVTAAAAQDWPQLQGPGRDGVYTGPWSEKSGFRQVWKRSIGEGFSPAVVAGGRVIVYHRDGSQDKIESLDPATGKTQWTYAYTTTYRDSFGFSEGPRSTPTVDGDRVYAYSAEGLLHGVNLASGKGIWKLDARKEYGIRQEFFGAACSPVVDGARLLMNIGGANGAGVVAIDKMTGKTLWKALSHESGYSSPVVASIGGARHALFFTREGLVDADPETGRIRFEHRWRARMAASVNAATPLVSGNQVFISSSYDTGAAVLEIQGDKFRTVWSGDESLSNHYSTSVHKDGYLYGFHGRQEEGQELRCVEWESGKVMWSQEGFRAGTVTLAGTHLFVLTEGGELVIAPASPKGFQVAKRVRVADELVRAYPALAEGRIYVRTSRGLASYRID